MPTSLIKVLTRTPVHSEVLVRPCAACAVLGAALREAALELPEHSMKRVREIEGKRFKSATEYFIGRSTMPWMSSRCWAGSMVGTPL